MSSIKIVCPFCGFSKEIAQEKIPAGAKRATCPRCRQPFELTFFTNKAEPVEKIDGNFSEDASSGYGKDSPWENRVEIGLLQGIFYTFRGVLFHPSSFFRELKTNHGLWEPMVFGLLAGSIGTMLSFFWQFLFMSGAMSKLGVPFFGHLAFGILFVFMIILVPLIITVGMFVYAAFLHLLLLLVRGGKSGFEASFRVIAFSQSAQLLALIPIIGGWIGLIWQLIVQAAGLKEIHRISYLRLFAAMLIPIPLIIVLVLAAALFFKFSVQNALTYI